MIDEVKSSDQRNFGFVYQFRTIFFQEFREMVFSRGFLYLVSGFLLIDLFLILILFLINYQIIPVDFFTIPEGLESQWTLSFSFGLYIGIPFLSLNIGYSSRLGNKIKKGTMRLYSSTFPERKTFLVGISISSIIGSIILILIGSFPFIVALAIIFSDSLLKIHIIFDFAYLLTITIVILILFAILASNIGLILGLYTRSNSLSVVLFLIYEILFYPIIFQGAILLGNNSFQLMAQQISLNFHLRVVMSSYVTSLSSAPIELNEIQPFLSVFVLFILIPVSLIYSIRFFQKLDLE